jgi:hypothetical protein
MAFQVGYRAGKVWDDLKYIDSVVKKTSFRVNFQNEREFENNFLSALNQHRDKINGNLYGQLDKDRVVKGVYLFGNNHRPDLTINDDGIAIELKFLNTTLVGLKQAIGQGMFYRVRYKFVINLFLVSSEYKQLYIDAAQGKESDLEQIFKDLSKSMNIFSYIVPNFSPGSNIKGLLEWNGLGDQ